MNPKQLYIRIITKRGDTFTSNNFVVKCRQDKPFTDEDADEALHNVVESLKRDLPEDATIIKAEFVPQQVFEYPIRDADKVMPWRTLDFVVQSLDYQFEPNQVGHPIFMPMLGECDKHWAVQEAIDTLRTKYLFTSLNPVLDSLKDPVKAAQHGEFDGTSASTLIASLAAFTSGKNYEDTVLYAIKFGGNTSMSAALAGGLAGIYYGVQNVPKRWTNVLANRDWVYKKIANHAIIA